MYQNTDAKKLVLSKETVEIPSKTADFILLGKKNKLKFWNKNVN